METAAGDGARLEAMVARRLRGEPLAWITGWVDFGALRLTIEPGVYVPRWQTEPLALRAAERLPDAGVAVDLCCGSGAVAAVLAACRPGAAVRAFDADPRAVACARRNGVDARVADLLAPPRPATPGIDAPPDGPPPAGPPQLPAAVDVVVAVPPYVPTRELGLLQRDTLTFEDRTHYDGGADGLAVARAVVGLARAHLRPGGALLLELGGDQPDALDLDGFAVSVLRDEEGDVRGVEALRRGR